MSWSVSFNVENGEVIEDTVTESNVEPDYHADQYETALDAVWKLIGSDVIGDETNKKFKVNISGHGNPGHEPLSGWGNDFISINIYQL